MIVYLYFKDEKNIENPQLFKVGRAITSSSFAHAMVLVKFELQTRKEHLSS
jgi:hypothetical protein